LSDFFWDKEKEFINIRKHGVDFLTAEKAFKDPKRKIFEDFLHSAHEKRFYCIGKVDDRVLTVRFTVRDFKIRIFGAGFWRKGRDYYEEEGF
jgi:uncharacterized DUF497 family protein